MSRIPNLARAVLALVALIVLGVLVIVVFGSQAGGPPVTPIAKATPTSVVQVTPTPVAQIIITPLPYPPPGNPTPPGPPATPTSVPASIPPCAFAAAPVPTPAGPSLDAYIFSDPRLVLTHTAAIEIAGWLPDGERLLITRNFPDTNRQVIETFNIRTGERQRYAERLNFSSRPAWLADRQAVAFVDITREEGGALRLSRGEKYPIETLQTHLAFPYLAADSTGRQVSVLLSARGIRPVITDVAGGTTRALSTQLPEAATTYEQAYHMMWSPQGKWLACYSAVGFYLIEVATGQGCEADLGGQQYAPGKRWALDAQWSPDERYLAMLTTTGRMLPAKFSDLTILDTSTGALRSIRPGADRATGPYYVTDMAWSPDSQTIAIRSAVEKKEGGLYEGLYLVEVKTGQLRRMLPQTVLIGGGYAGLSLAWSPDGSQLAVNWPTQTEGRLYLIAVTTRQ